MKNMKEEKEGEPGGKKHKQINEKIIKTKTS